MHPFISSPHNLLVLFMYHSTTVHVHVRYTQYLRLKPFNLIDCYSAISTRVLCCVILSCDCHCFVFLHAASTGCQRRGRCRRGRGTLRCVGMFQWTPQSVPAFELRQLQPCSSVQFSANVSRAQRPNPTLSCGSSLPSSTPHTVESYN